jgi:peptidoglycan hydrolase-like protein with peptidoglycan-binding domain
MSRLALCSVFLCASALLTAPAVAQEKDRPAREATKEKDGPEKAGEATKGAFEKAGEATEKGLKGAGKGVGTAVEETGQGVKAAGRATGGALKRSGEAVADFFDGDDGDEDRVREVQRALQQKGYYEGPIDGVVGPRTRAGVREFQGDQNLPVTGKVDDKTAKSLGVD